jgi:uncharacterized surface protein with fasciclin (FAS1) repeats
MKTTLRRGLFGLTMLAVAGAVLAIGVPAQAQTNSVFIRGTAFIDANENGKRDAGERSLFARYKVTNGGNFNVCQATAGNGGYTVGLTKTGTYFVMPIAGTGYHTTAPVIKVDAKANGATYTADLPFAPSALATAENCGAYEPKRTARVPWGIIETAQSAGFTTLVNAINAAGLFDTLSGKGPFTVFAPNDLAFAKIPDADLGALLKDKAALTGILTYHVVPGRVSANDVVNSDTLTTVNGKQLTISTNEEGEVLVNGARVIATDIQTANGIVHVIDTVLVP